VTTYRPFSDYWASLFGPQQRVTFFGTRPATTCVIFGTAIPQAVPVGSPYYSVQPGAVLGTTSPDPSVGIGAGPWNAAPFDLSPSNPATGGANVPADNPPRLNSNEIPGDTRTLNFPAAPSNSAFQATAKANLDEQPADGQPSAPQTRSGNFFNVTPIRDPESKPRRGVVDDIPDLLGPGNHTANHNPNGQASPMKVVPIQWHSTQHNDANQQLEPQGPTTAPSIGPRPVRRDWDDGGWRSAR